MGFTGLALGAMLHRDGIARAATLESVQARGYLRCGMPPPTPGFSQTDGIGSWRGMDADICRAIAAADKPHWFVCAACGCYGALDRRAIDEALKPGFKKVN